MNIVLPKSYSNIGKTADASQKRSTKVHVHKQKIILKPWDGLDLVEQILSENAKSDKSTNSREQLALSSPRVNPVLQEKVVAETSASAFATFLKSTATSLMPLLPAAAEDKVIMSSDDSEHDGDGSSLHGSEMSRRRGKKNGSTALNADSMRPSPCFLTGERPRSEMSSQAPPVGKYHPKYKIVERRPPTSVVFRHHKTRHTHNNKDTHHQSLMMTATEGETVHPEFSGTLTSLPDSRPGSHEAGRRTAADSSEARSPDHLRVLAKDCRSAFRSRTPRFPDKPPLDLLYWPLPFTGETTYRGGAFVPNARERPYTPFGVPQGADGDYNVTSPTGRASSAMDIGRSASREGHITRIMFGPVDTTQLSYNPKDKIVSTHPRPRSPCHMAKQLPRPPPRVASPAEPLDIYHNSLLTSHKKGMVDIGRMVAGEKAYTDDPQHPPQQLNPAHDIVEHHSPAYSFVKAGRVTGAADGPSLVDVSYDANDSSIRRHRPSWALTKSERKGFSPKGACLREEPYEVSERPNVVNVEFGKQISRERRDKRFEFR